MSVAILIPFLFVSSMHAIAILGRVMRVYDEDINFVSRDFRLYHESLRLFRTIFIATTAHIDIIGMCIVCSNYLSQATLFLCRMLVTIVGAIFEFFFTNSYNRYQLPPDAVGGGRRVERAHDSRTRYGNDNYERVSLTTTHEIVISKDEHGEFGLIFREINGVVTLWKLDDRHVNLIDGDVVREFNGVSVKSNSGLRELSSKMDDAFLVIERQICSSVNGNVNTEDVNPVDITQMEVNSGN